MKDTKTALKEAREAIKNKNYELSLKLCKQILKDDKCNYTALVFLGVSLQETGSSEKAIIAFKDAIGVNPSNPLAWNGIVNFYEKNDSPEAKTELVKAYLALLNLETNVKKLTEYSEKLGNYWNYGDFFEIITAIYGVFKSDKGQENIEFASILVNICSKNKKLPSDALQIYEEMLKVVLNNQKTVCINYYAEYLNFLYKQERHVELIENAKKMHSLFELDWISLRWICKIFNENFVETGNFIESCQEITKYYEKLLKLETQSATALFTKSILLVTDNKLIEARNLLDQVIILLPGLLHAWILQLKCCIQLLFFPEALQAVTKIDKLLQSANDSKKQILQSNVSRLMIEALSKSDEANDLKKALEIYETLEADLKNECLPHIIRANINLANFSKAKLFLSDLNKVKGNEMINKLLLAQLLHKQKKYNEALDLLLVEKEANFSEWWLEIGMIYWDCGQFEKSLIPFLKATKIDPNNYKCFLLLGHYYKKIEDNDKARRCYEKAFKINSKSADAGIELSKIYRKMKNWDANLNLLQSLTTAVINKKNCWAWMQLGLHYLEQQEYDNSITNLRFVIRIDDTNMHCWESLADAYLAKGAYTSALKCYAKASELSEGSLYPLLQMANIKQILGEYIEARADFEEILLTNKHYVPALKGMAETCLLQAKECFKNQRLGTSRDHAQLAADKTIIAIKECNNLACLWKLLGDCCYFITNLPEKFCCLLLPSAFVEGREIEGNKILEKVDLFTLAARSYSKSLTLIEDNILIWHDLAACFLSHALSTENHELSVDLMKKSRVIAEFCANKNPTHWQHWNLIGNIAFNQNPPNFCLAQHAFIKAVIADNNSAIAWCNLGALYFKLNEFKLANQAFSQAQRSDPNYVNSWVGQALLAEFLMHEDAMDLFRHSTQLGIHRQGTLGYAHWVCKTLMEAPLDSVIYSIHNMHAIPVACDAITWYTEHNPENSSAWNMLGILRERMGLKQGALEAFKNALALSSGENRDLAKINYGRLLTTLDKCEQAIEILTKIQTATFNSGSGLALALFKDGLYKESYEAYESTLHWLSDEPHFQSDLLVALASMAYVFEGLEAAKTLLFQSVQLEKSSPWGFYAILSLALLHEDFKLAELVLNEMGDIKDDRNCVQHYAILLGYYHLIKGDGKRSIREICKIIHKFPDLAPLWLSLSSLIIRLKCEEKLAKAAAKCAQAAMKLGQSHMDVTKVLCLVSVSSLSVGDNNKALVMAQKAVHCYPNVAEAWAVLGASLQKQKKIPVNNLRNILKHVSDVCDSDGLNEWVQKALRSL